MRFRFPHAGFASAPVEPAPRASIALLAAATLAQGGLVAYAIEASALGWVALLLTSAALAYFVVCLFERRRPYLLASTVAMLALGNVGMLVGWLAEFGFEPVARAGVCFCGCWAAPAGTEAASGPGWMEWGMLLACLPALALTRPAARYLCAAKSRRREWAIHACACPPGMLAGMLLAAAAIAPFPIAEPALQFVASFAAMSAGMVVGMAASCLALDALQVAHS